MRRLLVVVAAGACENVNVTIVTTIPVTPSWSMGTSKAHLNEMLLALGENSRSMEVGEIRVLLDDGPTDKDALKTVSRQVNSDGWSAAVDAVATSQLRTDVRKIQKMLSNKLDGASSDLDLQKIKAHVFGRQPTYAELFRYANELSGRIVAVANADIVLRNMHLVDPEAFLHGTTSPLAMALAVRPPTGKFGSACQTNVDDRCISATYDGFLVALPLVGTPRYDILEEFRPAPVYMNEWGAGDRAHQFLSASGYDIVNPCLANLTEHWHCSTVPKRLSYSSSSSSSNNNDRRPWSPIPISTDSRGLRPHCSP